MCAVHCLIAAVGIGKESLGCIQRCEGELLELAKEQLVDLD